MKGIRQVAVAAVLSAGLVSVAEALCSSALVSVSACQ